jgi:hypothetical protein
VVRSYAENNLLMGNEVNLNDSLTHLDNAIKTVVTKDLIMKSFVESLDL